VVGKQFFCPPEATMGFTMKVERVVHDEVFSLLVASGLFQDVTLTVTAADVGQAFDGSNLVTTARDSGGKLIAVCRALTDFTRHCFVATLAVHPEAKGKGVGKSLLNFTHAQAGDPKRIVIFLHSAPESVGFYEAIGFKRELTCFSPNNIS
jgi:ribosomal protein S18 acetylase RimI-like enzyme